MIAVNLYSNTLACTVLVLSNVTDMAIPIPNIC